MDIVDEAKELIPWLDEDSLVTRMAKHIECLRLKAREAADEIERLRQQNAELVEALRCFLALETPHTWLYKRNKAEALVKESLSTELFNELQSNRG